MRYSLANYICSIKPNDPSMLSVFGTISIGGEGSVVDSLTVSRSNQLFSTTSYATGGYVHNKNLSKTGTISITLNQLADHLSDLKRLVNMFQTQEYPGLTISLATSDGEEICSGIDCVPTQIPSQEFRSEAATQSWSFSCGEIIFK